MTFMVGAWCVMSKDERRSVTRQRTIEVENVQIEVQVKNVEIEVQVGNIEIEVQVET